MDMQAFFLDMIRHDINELLVNDYGITLTNSTNSYCNNLYEGEFFFDEFKLTVQIHTDTGKSIITLYNLDENQEVDQNDSILLTDYESYNAILIEIYELLKQLGY